MDIQYDEDLMLFDENGNAITHVSMREAHARLSAFFTPTDRGHAYGWPERHAAETLAALFTGRDE